jgi:cell division protein FtsB
MDDQMKKLKTTDRTPDQSQRDRKPKAGEATGESFSQQLGSFFRRNMNWFLLAGFMLLLLQDVFGTHGVLATHRSQVEARKIQAEINLLDKENQKLQNHVKDLKTDPATIECIAREDMGLARPGELVFKTQLRSADTSQGVAQLPCNSQKP